MNKPVSRVWLHERGIVSGENCYSIVVEHGAEQDTPLA